MDSLLVESQILYETSRRNDKLNWNFEIEGDQLLKFQENPIVSKGRRNVGLKLPQQKSKLLNGDSLLHTLTWHRNAEVLFGKQDQFNCVQPHDV